MKTTEKSAVTLRGELSASHICFNEISGEVVVRGTVLYQGRTYQNIPIITLRIFRNTQQTQVQEYWFIGLIPRLEAIQDFRDDLRLTLGRHLDKLSFDTAAFVLDNGLRQFLEKLRTYKVNTCLVRGLRSAANGLNESSDMDAGRARMALRAMGITPPDEVELITKN